MTAAQSANRRFGEILVENGYLTPSQLEQVLREQSRKPGVALGQVCIDLGFLSRERLQLLLHRYGKRLPLGEMLVASGIISGEHLARALEIQEMSGGRLGEILLRERFVSEKSFYSVLTRQYNLPFVPVGSLAPAPELAEVVSAPYAAQHGLVPISLSGGLLTVAVSDPSKPEPLAELTTLTGFRTRAVLSPPSEIESAFMSLYGVSSNTAILDRPDARAKQATMKPSRSQDLTLPASFANEDPAPRLDTPLSLDSTFDLEAPLSGAKGKSQLELTPFQPQPAKSRLARRPMRAAERGFLNDEDALRREFSPWSDSTAGEGFDPSMLPSTRLLGEEEPQDPAWNDGPSLEVIEEEPTTAPRSRYAAGEDSQVVQNIVQGIIRRALSLRASDIHLETTASGPRLRLRVDGVLQQHPLGEMQDAFRSMYRSVVSRLKILAQLDITERRRPQDGSFRMMSKTKDALSAVDFRMSTLPTRFGESVVIRVLEQQRAPRSLESLGLSLDVLEQFHAMIQRPTGIILITGPTGSGKSSTLYAALRTIYQPGIKILTAEDPIEYTHPGIIQTEVNPGIENTFARYLRSFLRQDPDVMMVGEIRDAETAEMALRAAQTGHLLLSTLHTNDATSSVQRLLDLEMEPNSVASSVIGVMAQRLVRKICASCIESYEPERYLLEEWFLSVPDSLMLRRGKGCETCHGTGFSGRVAVAELWQPSSHEVLLINKEAPSSELRAEALTHMRSIGEDALRKALAGLTTLEEAFRIVPYADVRHTREVRSTAILHELSAAA